MYQKIKRVSWTMKKFRPFTLVELLVVVAILAILAGGAVAVYDGFDRKAAKGQAINQIALLEKLIQNYGQLNDGLYPENFDSLLSIPSDKIKDAAKLTYSYAGGTDVRKTQGFISATPKDNRVDGVLEIDDLDDSGISVVSWLSEELLTRLQFVQVDQRIVDILVSSGIRSLRYVDQGGDHSTSTSKSVTVRDASDTGTKIEKSEDIIDASKAFENPSAPNDTVLRNMGRGFTFRMSADPQNLDQGVKLGSNITDRMTLVAIAPGESGFVNSRVGGNPGDLILAFGIGNNSSLVNTEEGSGDVNRVKATAGFSTAPRYENAPSKIYARYIALFKVAEYIVNGSSDTNFVGGDSKTTPRPGRTYIGGLAYHRFQPDTVLEYNPGAPATQGIRYSENGALFVGIIDCYGNTARELSNQYND